MTTDILKDYYHQDRLGSTTNLTDKFGRVVGRADYNEWGEITYREALTITSSYRRIYPQSSYTGHDYDEVLNLYYAKARFYSAEDKRFVAVDPVKGTVTDPRTLVPYVYCADSPLVYIDPNGEVFFLVTGAIGAAVGGIVGGVTAAYKSYRETGKVNVGSVFTSALVGVAAGGIIGMGAGAVATAVASTAVTTTVSTASALSTAGVLAGSKTAVSAAIGATMSGTITAASSYGNSGNKKIDVAKTVVSMTTGAITGSLIPNVEPITNIVANAFASGGQSVANSMIDKARGEKISSKQIGYDAGISFIVGGATSAFLGKVSDPLTRTFSSAYVRAPGFGAPTTVAPHTTATGKYLIRNLMNDAARNLGMSNVVTEVVDKAADFFSKVSCRNDKE